MININIFKVFNTNRIRITFALLLVLTFSFFFKAKDFDIKYDLKDKIPPDLTILGPIKYEDGLGRLGITISKALSKNCDVLIIPSSFSTEKDIEDLKKLNIKVLQENKPIKSKVSLLTNLLWLQNFTPIASLPQSDIKIAYSMLESSAIPEQWVTLINKFLDAVIVPDKALVKVYKNSGVNKPIFILSPILDLKNFLKKPPKLAPNKIFTFGMSAGFWPRKNHKLLIQAFAGLFKNNPKVQLKLHGRFGDRTTKREIQKLIKELNSNNIFLLDGILEDKKYQDFIASLDCYVFISAGEGFSITPREAIAAGVPCILSNNSAHKTICDTGLVQSIACTKLEAANYKSVFNSYVGFQNSPEIIDVKKALEEVYTNYPKWLKKAKRLRKWSEQYQTKNLASYYLSLVKPKNITFGKKNIIKSDCIVSNSIELLEKYKKLYPELNLKKEIKKNNPDLTIYGIIKYADGLGRLPVIAIDSLKDELLINFITSRKKPYINLKDIKPEITDILNDKNFKNKIGKIIFFTDLLSVHWDNPSNYIPKNSNAIKIAYTMVESDRVPKKWVDIINSKFDAIAVPDDFLKTVYQKSGVTKPIFVLPVAMDLNNFFSQPLKTSKNQIFTFGCSGGFWSRKNHTKLIKAFAHAFSNNPKVLLKIHARAGENKERKKVYSLIDKFKLNNVEIIDNSLSQKQYINFLKSLDCYVFLSRGEGFSLTPREALALGIPTIVTNNSAQRTICNTGYVRSVPANIAVPAYYSHLKQFSGYEYDCTTQEAAQALLDVYKNYKKYLAKAQKAKNWVKQNELSKIKELYKNLLNPKTVLLGNIDVILPEGFTTTSKDFYSKYLANLKN